MKTISINYRNHRTVHGPSLSVYSYVILGIPTLSAAIDRHRQQRQMRNCFFHRLDTDKLLRACQCFQMQWWSMSHYNTTTTSNALQVQKENADTVCRKLMATKTSIRICHRAGLEDSSAGFKHSTGLSMTDAKLHFRSYTSIIWGKIHDASGYFFFSFFLSTALFFICFASQYFKNFITFASSLQTCSLRTSKAVQNWAFGYPV